jgi:hypothetical protein
MEWTDEEIEIIRECYPAGDRLSLLKRLPHRSWGSIKQLAFYKGISRPSSCNPDRLGFDRFTSYADYEFCRSLGIDPHSKETIRLKSQLQGVHTTASVHFNRVEGGFAIGPIDLETEAVIPGIDEETFQRFAQDAKAGCPVSKALAATPINLKATLVK